MNNSNNRIFRDCYLSEFTRDELRRLIFWDEKCGLSKQFPETLKRVLTKLNSVIHALNLVVPRNIPYMSIGCFAYVNEFTRVFIRDRANFETSQLMLQIDSELKNFVDISHMLDLYECNGRAMDEGEGDMSGQLIFDNNFRELAIIDVFLDVAFFNSFSFLKELPSTEKQEFSKKKYEFFKRKKLESFFDDESNDRLEYYSFAFSCHTQNKEIINATTYEYEIDLEKYISIWNEFVREHFPNKTHVELPVKEQIAQRINNHIPNDYFEKFEGKEPGIYFLLRTEKKNISPKYEDAVCSLFGIKTCTVGQLAIIKQSDFYKHENLFKGANVSVFKVVIQ